MNRLLLLFLLAAPCVAFDTDLVFPWVTNNSFQSQIVINNLSPDTALVNMTATRQSGNDPLSETVTDIEIGPNAQWSQTAADLFPGLGQGSGYMVRLTSTADSIQAGFVVRAGTSPSQANVIPASQASTKLVFNFLTAADDGFAAPVVINMGDQPANVTYHGFQDGQEIYPLNLDRPTQRIPANHPHAQLVTDLFPDTVGNLLIVVESDMPLLGTTFIFNGQGEPSMANAVPVAEVPGETYVLTPIRPVPTNGEHWLSYELMVQNRSDQSVDMTRIDVLDGDTLLTSRSSFTLLNDTSTGSREVQAGLLNLVYMDLAIPSDAIPHGLNHRITFNDGTQRTYQAPIINETPIVLSPPMRGSNWLSANSFSDDNHHRRSLINAKGKFVIPQRFAIDWVKLNPSQNATFTGSGSSNTHYHAYGQDLLAVADGVVIHLRDGVGDNAPQNVPNLTNSEAGGNYLIIDLGNDLYALYAHCQAGSFTIAEGDRVSRGDVIAKIGNSGNTTQPHLHFHLNRYYPGPFGFEEQGMPYVFDTYRNMSNQSKENELPRSGDIVHFEGSGKTKWTEHPPSQYPPVSYSIPRFKCGLHFQQPKSSEPADLGTLR